MAPRSAIQLFPHSNDDLLIDRHGADLASLALDGNDVLPERLLRRGGVQSKALVDAETGEREEIAEGSTANALQYEMMDMEAAILEGKTDVMRLSDSCDVMDMMTGLRKEWGMKYPGEEW